MEPAPVFADDRDAAALARAQWRQARLDELAEIGMGHVRGLGVGEGRDETALGAMVRRYIRLSRALRLVLTLAAWVSDYILALMRGETIPEPWRRPRPSAAHRAGAPVTAGAEVPDASDAAEEVESREASDRSESCRADAEPREPAERFAYASWDEAINAICNAFGIEDRSRFLESDSFPARSAALAGAAAPVADARSAAPPRPAPPPPAPPRSSPWAPGGVLPRKAFLRASTALPDERALQ